MNRRKFAHSWGRKLFFGISWPLSMAIGCIYLTSFILPETPIDWIYFVLTYVGHFGLLNLICYFILFAPLASITPSYYFTRFWSLIIILTLNSFIAVDALVFSQYHAHIYDYLWPIFLENSGYVFTHPLAFPVFLGVLLLLGIYIWVRGEFHWRFMQGRFSNPIKNWYVVLIIIFFGASKVMFYSLDIAPKLGMMLPLDYNNVTHEHLESLDAQNFVNPYANIQCEENETPNLVLVLINDWDAKDITEEGLPHLYHVKKHGVFFEKHLNVNENRTESEFSLLYMLPGAYLNAVPVKENAFFKEAEKKNYKYYVQNPSELNLKEIISTSRESGNPFILKVNAGPQEADKVVHDMTVEFQKKGLLEKTHFIITGVNTAPGTIPFIYLAPDAKSSHVEGVTSHYDILSSFMKTIWNCKKMPKIEGVEKDWYLVSHPVGYKIYDLKDSGSVLYDGKKLSIEGNPRTELIFSSLKIMNRFFKP